MTQAYTGKDIKVLTITMSRLNHLHCSMMYSQSQAPGVSTQPPATLWFHLSLPAPFSVVTAWVLQRPQDSSPKHEPKSSVSRASKSQWTSMLSTHHIFRWDPSILQPLSRGGFSHVLSRVAIFILPIHKCPWGMLKAQTECCLPVQGFPVTRYSSDACAT